MIKKFGPILMVFLFLASCVKETYDLDKLDKSARLSPSLVFSALKGKVTFADVVTLNDTVVEDENGFVSLMIRKDSAFYLTLDDFYDFGNMVSFSKSYEFGNLSLSDFTGTMGFSLRQISQRFPDGGAAISSLDDGGYHTFPAFGATALPESTFSGITNFQSATFASGSLDISVTNNLTTPISGFSVSLYNVSGHTFIAGPLSYNNTLLPGQTAVLNFDLTNKIVTNTISAAVTLSGSPGNPNQLISLDNSNILFSAHGRNLKVSSGRVILPAQGVVLPQTQDVVSFNPGTGIELEKMKISSGNLTCQVRSTSPLNASLTLTLTSSLRNGVPVTETLNLSAFDQYTRYISFTNTELNLNSDPVQPYNKVPFTYSINVTSAGNMVTFSSHDMVSVYLTMMNPGFDYIKGFFGQQVETIPSETEDFGIDEYLSKMSGDILFSNPSIKIRYSNSFAIPMEVMVDGKATHGTETANLGLNQNITVAKPDAPAARDITSEFIVDKSNSSLPGFVSLPPSTIVFSGSAKMNPSGDPSHLRNNYVFGNSRLICSFELNLPLQFKSNFTLSDTIDNFMSTDEGSSDFSFDNFSNILLEINARNGFPLDVSLKIRLFDSSRGVTLSTIDAADLINAAPVDANGKSTGETETTTPVEFTPAFLDAVNNADKIILDFGLVTPENGNREIKIYSDYSINFNVRLSATIDKTFDLK